MLSILIWKIRDENNTNILTLLWDMNRITCLKCLSHSQAHGNTINLATIVSPQYYKLSYYCVPLILSGHTGLVRSSPATSWSSWRAKDEPCWGLPRLGECRGKAASLSLNIGQPWRQLPWRQADGAATRGIGSNLNPRCWPQLHDLSQVTSSFPVWLSSL